MSPLSSALESNGWWTNPRVTPSCHPSPKRQATPNQQIHSDPREKYKCGWISSPRCWGLLSHPSTSAPGSLNGEYPKAQFPSERGAPAQPPGGRGPLPTSSRNSQSSLEGALLPKSRLRGQLLPWQGYLWLWGWSSPQPQSTVAAGTNCAVSSGGRLKWTWSKRPSVERK